jgi:hypothetical protein
VDLPSWYAQSNDDIFLPIICGVAIEDIGNIYGSVMRV